MGTHTNNMVSIALSMITKNSLEKVGKYFEKVWNSSLQVPYKLIILIDYSDNENTKNFVKNFADLHNKELIVTQSRLYGWHKPTRATARQTAIDIFLNNTNFEWLFFLDDDFILRNNWWQEASSYLPNPEIGLIWGIDFTPFWKERNMWLRVRGYDEVSYAIKNFEIRGGLHDTLLRRKAIENIELPPWANVFEDAWVKRFIECKGFKYAIVRTGGDHLRHEKTGGYSKNDFEIMAKISAILRLEPISFPLLVETIIGLPGYIYFAKKAGRTIYQAYEMWRHRLTYRAKLLKFTIKYKKYNPCEIVTNWKNLNIYM